jgi:hypothetical protein
MAQGSGRDEGGSARAPAPLPNLLPFLLTLVRTGFLGTAGVLNEFSLRPAEKACDFWIEAFRCVRVESLFPDLASMLLA